MRRRKAPDISSQRRRCRWRITSTGRQAEFAHRYRDVDSTCSLLLALALLGGHLEAGCRRVGLVGPFARSQPLICAVLAHVAAGEPFAVPILSHRLVVHEVLGREAERIDHPVELAAIADASRCLVQKRTGILAALAPPGGTLPPGPGPPEPPARARPPGAGRPGGGAAPRSGGPMPPATAVPRSP